MATAAVVLLIHDAIFALFYDLFTFIDEKSKNNNSFVFSFGDLFTFYTFRRSDVSHRVDELIKEVVMLMRAREHDLVRPKSL